MNLLLIDSSLPDSRIFYDAVNADTIPLLYSDSSKSDILSILQQHSFVRMGIVFIHNQFLGQSFFDSREFFISLGVSHIDFLACETLNDDGWVEFYSSLSPITVGASNNKTGNNKYGGDWVMESTGENIQHIYFDNISSLSSLLDAAPDHIIAIKSDGTIWGFGNNMTGQLGLGDTAYRITFTQITNFNGRPQSVSSGSFHTMILMANKSIWCTGYNYSGQLGLGDSSDRNTLTRITSDISGCKPLSISCGSDHTMVLMTNDTIWGSGLNLYGQLGLGDIIYKNTLTQTTVPTGRIPKYISCGGSHTMVLMMDNTIWGTGLNGSGQLGLGDTSDRNILTQITSDISGCTPLSIYCGNFHTMVLMTNGTIWGTGYNGYGQLGLGNTSNRNILTQITSDISGCTPKSISCGGVHTMVLMTNDTIWGTGKNNIGQLGLGNTTQKTTLTQITSDISGCIPLSISGGSLNTVVLMTDGTIWVTGSVYGIGNINTLARFITNNSDFSYVAGTDIVFNVPCFKEGTFILTIDGYRLIEDLRKGDLVKTVYGHIPIHAIGKRQLNHLALDERIKDQLYEYKTHDTPLVITGTHSVLVDAFTDETQKNNTKNILGKIYVTDNKYRLPACVDDRATIYAIPGTYTIYHLALEHDDYYMNYGIYANGLFVETCSKRYLNELSNMELIE
jgi:alpha-tubulin suppressor-like RCC1 family protein